ncbi:MAG: hypothetical protein AABX16_01040, partial [Nanoarchaeota archaeon]
MKDKIIVSTDIGSDPDDALSILAMINTGLNVSAIYTTNAKDLSIRSYIAKHVVNLAQKNIVVAQGEAHPVFSPTSPYWFFDECFVDDSFIDDEASLGKDIEYISLENAGIV